MTILALDLGTKTGFAMSVEGQIFSGTICFSNGRFEGGGMRFLKFQNWLLKIEPKPTQIFFEEVRRHLGVDASHAYGGFLGVLSSWCEKNKIAYDGVPVATIKKHITGKGNANKQLVISAIKEKGFNPTDDNEADALALLDYCNTQSLG